MHQLKPVTLSLREICEVLEIEVPSQFEADADDEFSLIAGSTQVAKPGCAYFVRMQKLSDEEEAAEAIALGARLLFSSTQLRDKSGAELPCVIITDPHAAFIKVIASIKARFQVTTIAITGSVGKTTVKDMLAAITQQEFKALSSEDNHNTTAYAGAYVQKITDLTELYIQELGAGHFGVVEAGARMLTPDAYVVTSIGDNHIAHYGGSRKNILSDKLSLDTHLHKYGVGFVCFDDPALRAYHYTHNIYSYAMHSTGADYYAQDISFDGKKITFTVVERFSEIQTELTLFATGLHNVANALAAFAVCRWLGMTEAAIEAGLHRYHPADTRQNYVRIKGQRVFIDSINSSEISLKAAVETIKTLEVPEGGSRILVAGDIAELGDISKEVHRRLGRYLADQKELETILLFGPEMHAAYEELADSEAEIRHTENRTELETWIREILHPDDLIAFKASKSMELTKSIDNIFETDYYRA